MTMIDLTLLERLSVWLPCVNIVVSLAMTISLMYVAGCFDKISKSVSYTGKALPNAAKSMRFAALAETGELINVLETYSNWPFLPFLCAAVEIIGLLGFTVFAIKIVLIIPDILEGEKQRKAEERQRKLIEAKERETQAMLRKSEATFRAFCNAPYICLIRSKRNGIVYINPTFESLFSTQLDRIRNCRYAMLFPSTKAEELEANDIRVFRTGIPTQTVERWETSEGERDWQVYRFIVDPDEDNENERRIGVVAFDISAQTQLARDLERSNQELEQFGYSVSHDLQQPLRSISSFTQYLRQDLEQRGILDEERLDYIRRIQRASTRMKDLIDDLLTYSRVGRMGDLNQRINLNLLMAAVIENLQAKIDETGAVIEIDELPTVNGDDSQLLQLFQNLVSNGIKYMPRDRIPNIRIKLNRKDKFWIICVQDNGIGIAPEYTESIFQVFKRLHTSDEYEGSGMGLAICKKIVTHHKGKIWLKSEPGKGSIFCFTLPVQEGT